MALEFQCSHEGISDTELVGAGDKRYTGGTWYGINTNASFVRTGARSVRIGNGGGNHAELNKAQMSNQATRTIGFAFHYEAGATMVSSDSVICGVGDGTSIGATLFLGSGSWQTALCIASTGALCFYRGRNTNSGGTKIVSNSSLTLTRGLTYFIEATITVHGSAGVTKVYVDGVEYPNQSSLNTQNTANAYSNVVAFQAAAPASWYLDDVYVRNDTTRYGPSWRCVGILPSGGNGANDQWTKSTGSDAGALLDETTPNNSDYISETTVGEKTTVPMGSVGYAGTVTGVTIDLYCQKGDVGARSIAPVQRHSGADYDGTTVVLAQNFASQVYEVFETNPATASAYTVSEIDAMELGAKLIA